jgi:glyoxylate/hydroxypyruvate reductase A
MALLLLMPNRDTSRLIAHIRSKLPDIDLRVWPETGNESEIDFVVTWNHPPGELGRFPGLKAISSFGAGVDHILRDPALPKNIPITRIIDENLIHDLTEYVIAVVLSDKRSLNDYRTKQQEKSWSPLPVSREKSVGVMGLGRIGGRIAAAFALMDFVVYGWDRAPKNIAYVHSFEGEERLSEFLAEVDYLVCCLPLTPKTNSILNRKLFDQLKRGAYVINVGRGDHLVEEDLLQAIDEGRLSGACLDVFRTEPLPTDHPFWSHPKITVTPHISALTEPESAAEQIVNNYKRVKQGKEPLNTIDIELGF